MRSKFAFVIPGREGNTNTMTTMHTIPVKAPAIKKTNRFRVIDCPKEQQRGAVSQAAEPFNYPDRRRSAQANPGQHDPSNGTIGPRCNVVVKIFLIPMGFRGHHPYFHLRRQAAAVAKILFLANGYVLHVHSHWTF